MTTRKRTPSQAVPALLEKLRQQFEHSRRKRKPRSPIPDRLWAQAVKMAQQYGIHRTVGQGAAPKVSSRSPPRQRPGNGQPIGDR